MFRGPKTAYLPLNLLSDGLVIHPEDNFQTKKLQEHSRTASTKKKSQLKTNYFIGNIPLNALLFADDQIVLADSEENLQRTVFS
jgi:hypothetical protein